jgi:membrane-associated protease RseP (regulator of RpoE activity)
VTEETRRLEKSWLHIVLFLITLLTTTAAGALQTGADPLENPWALLAGLPFSLTLMSILLVHEMGHYLVSRHHGVKASLPYFIPAPSFIGTFGAFIRMQSPPPDRRSLFDVAAAGPLAGLVLAVPAVIVGLQLSPITAQESVSGNVSLGSSLLLEFLSKATLGLSPENVDILRHPIGFAGWIGLLVTALNLLPVGQLDGGHVIYALFGRRAIWIARLALVTILTLGVLRWWDGWLIWGVLLLFLGIRHPPPLDPYTPLDFKRKIAGWITLGILVVTFTPAPFTIQEPEVYQEQHSPEPVEPALQVTHSINSGSP